MSQGCFQCGAASTYVLFPLELVGCTDCFRAWIREESLSVEAIEATVGAYDGRSRTYHRHCEAFDAELLKRTQAWVAERTKARAA